jgi:predicted TIM-barrel fold metal-dependent hydrolase
VSKTPEDLVLLSIDDHMIEAPDLFERHLPARFQERAPRLRRGDDGVDKWMFEGEAVGVAGLGAVATWPKEEWSMNPVSLAEMRPGTYDVHQRVRDMNADGVLAGMNFPTFAGFGGTHLAKFADQELVAAAIAAWNDYSILDWGGQYPGRFIPMGIVPFHDPDRAVTEIHRIAALGAVAVSLPETPYGAGLPDFASGHWDPIFAALCDHGMVACMHIGGSFGLVQRPPSATVDDIIMLAPQLMAITVTDIILGGLLTRFPDQRFALSEGGIGWVSFFLDRLDRHMTNQSWTHPDKLPKGKTPTDVWKERFLACFITDPTALRVRDRIGVETIAWECDYPHSDSPWPASAEFLWRQLVDAGCSDDEIDKITWANVARFFHYDPFAHVPRERATVGALRAQAADVDVRETSRQEYRRRSEAAHTPA